MLSLYIDKEWELIPRPLATVVQSLSSMHFGGVARALARRGRISLESETGRVLTVYV